MGVALAPHKNPQQQQQQHPAPAEPQQDCARLACCRRPSSIPSSSSKENSRPNQELERSARAPQSSASSSPAAAAMPVTAIKNHKKKKKKKPQHATVAPPAGSSSPPASSSSWIEEEEFVSLLKAQDLQPTVEALRCSCAASSQHQDLAEIDKVLEVVAPKVLSTSCARNPPPCVCRLKNPGRLRKLSLQSVWDWFEEPSICGIQVKSCGEGDDRFDAYLVPYISAIRLFGNRSDETVPLLFEFYETEQLTLRLPLHHRIQELLKENPSSCIINGDPTLLERCSLRSLHPSSWFAVAWYPIYKVPEGQFRCVFLTYHSLGHVQASGSLPVLGLQTYHCQVEQWFTLKQGNEDCSETLKQRLTSLDRAALVMSRGSDPVSQKFQHSDYEFFTSRKY
ncbi:hypothetical protein SELMODRAFT_405313 [Selaginella moellendorffii]|uniref:Uncharacterized protein n=1 Tax=Selaginella moellendorffii TaxID=88036 RepID=D8QWY4_SELML|nr:uncharacterized protein LOC9643654 isoform X1 [Selaginella moellendorffii]EFJ35315.1 hypothetical protein SELMODRAFT_405313 [Selaginella moellendorffii]|eukprot:XP_002963444.1 uncharacterized protein LOC9643654 isoform X1 [Selaginella moellendorffii]